MQRRTFLGFTLLTLASLSGCSNMPKLPQGKTAPPEPDDWQALASRFSGELLLPQAEHFDRLRKAANARYDELVPAVIMRCANAADVQLAVNFVRDFALPFAVRSGGHSYTGLSSTKGVLIDVGLMQQITLEDDIATIGSGAKLGDVYAELGARQRSIPAGSCASVGIAGLVQGGGLGIADRRYGLTCDALQSADIVTADGQLRHCSATEHPDLFWALRGGGGGQFGIVTRLQFQTFPTAPIRNYIGRYPLKHGLQVLQNWQQWLSELPNEIWSQATIWFNGQQNEPEIQIRACALGEPLLLTRHWQLLELRLIGIWSDVDMQDHQYLDFMLSDCAGLEMPQCKLPNQHQDGVLKRVAMAGSSDIFDRYLHSSALNTLLREITKRHQNGHRGGVMLTAMGGAIKHLHHDDTAFAHRHALLSAQYLMSGPVGSPESLLKEGAVWVNRMRHLMKTWSSGGAYLNYTDALLKNWQQAYYGDHYARLQQIKTRYDKAQLFRFAQGIKPA